jgi:hypothetical protein
VVGEVVVTFRFEQITGISCTIERKEREETKKEETKKEETKKEER